nr:hypothetical protein [Massilia cavernae]
MNYEWIEIPVAIEQVVLVFHAAGGNDCAYRLAYSDAERTQCAKIPGGLKRDGLPAKIDHDQRSQHFFRPVEIALCPETLQHLSQDKIANGDWFVAKHGIQCVGLRRRFAPEVVNPNA